MSDAQRALEREYCPPIDPALFFAILSDFDLNNESQISSARETLDALKTSALEQESAGFNPSGFVTKDEDVGEIGKVELADTSSAADFSQSEETDVTSVSNGVDSLHIGNEFVVEAEELDEKTKILMLREMFPNSSEFSISHTLKSCGGNWTRALEELLNHTFFDSQDDVQIDDKIFAKGVDAFSEVHASRRGRKKNRKVKRQTDGDIPLICSNSSSRSPSTNTWDEARKDIEFLRLRVNVASSLISSTYHKNGASLPATILAIIETVRMSTTSVTDPITQANALELGKDFPSLDTDCLVGLIQLTHPSTAAAHELAKALASPRRSKIQGSIEVIPKYAPLSLDDENGERGWTTVNQQRKARFGTSTPRSSHLEATATANSYLQAQQRSFEQASAAYRRGKSDHLMSAAAAYYSQQGRDLAVKRAEATAEAADALVDSQSTADEVDLHGVSVKDAVRIARYRTESWWRQRTARIMGLDGRVRAEGDGGQSLRFVTGMGHHSSDGRAKIGPAVGRMLFMEGWNVSVGQGNLTVQGKKR